MANPIMGISDYNVNPAESSQSLQAYIELVYVKTANGILVNSLTGLEQSLGITKSVLDDLASLQSLKNLIVIKQPPPFSYGPGGIAAGAGSSNTSTTEANNYMAAVSTYFNTPAQFSISFTSTISQASAYGQFIQLASKLSADIALLASSTPTLPGGGIDPNSLLAKAQTVLADIRGAGLPNTNNNTQLGAVVGEALMTWVTDHYSVTDPGDTSSGKIQQNLNYAITAAESLNTSQTSSIKNYLFIFEEYYKSAAALITAINQIILRMAAAIKT